MKTLLLSTVALVGLGAAALAADLPLRAAPPPPVPVMPAFTWTGFYAGVNGGYAFPGDDRRYPARFRFIPNRTPGGGGGDGGDGGEDPPPTDGAAPQSATKVRGGRIVSRGHLRDQLDGSGLGGAQVGYNMQFGMFVAGLEADAQAIDFDAINGRNPVLKRGRVSFREGDVDIFGTVRGRLGVAFDRVLVYGTGGLAWRVEEEDNKGGGAFRGLRLPGGKNGGEDDLGWTVGGGVEYAFTTNISVKVEGLYVSFDDGNGRKGGRGAFGSLARGNDDEFGLVRAGVNYRW